MRIEAHELVIIILVIFGCFYVTMISSDLGQIVEVPENATAIEKVQDLQNNFNTCVKERAAFEVIAVDHDELCSKEIEDLDKKKKIIPRLIFVVIMLGMMLVFFMIIAFADNKEIKRLRKVLRKEIKERDKLILKIIKIKGRVKKK